MSQVSNAWSSSSCAIWSQWWTSSFSPLAVRGQSLVSSRFVGSAAASLRVVVDFVRSATFAPFNSLGCFDLVSRMTGSLSHLLLAERRQHYSSPLSSVKETLGTRSTLLTVGGFIRKEKALTCGDSYTKPAEWVAPKKAAAACSQHSENGSQSQPCHNQTASAAALIHPRLPEPEQPLRREWDTWAALLSSDARTNARAMVVAHFTPARLLRSRWVGSPHF
jgi:hypothetical protein